MELILWILKPSGERARYLCRKKLFINSKASKGTCSQRGGNMRLYRGICACTATLCRSEAAAGQLRGTSFFAR